MKKFIRIAIYFLFFMMSLFIPNVVHALVMVETGPVVNEFTLDTNFPANVTFEYYYVDENDVEHSLKQSITNTYSNGSTITFSPDTTVDYSRVEYYVNGSLYSGNTYTVNGNATIKEVYYLNRYTITYNLNGGTNNSNNPTTYTSMSGTITINAPTRTSATFTGWTWTGQTTPTTTLSFNSTDKENKTFTANWQLLTYTLKSGQNLASTFTNKTDVIFGNTADYPTIAQGTGTLVGATSSDLIYAYTSGTTVYILSDRIISFNSYSNNMFYGKTTITSITFDNIDTSNVTNMASMFYGAKNITSLDLTMFNTSNVNTMQNMFTNTDALVSVDLSSFNTSNVTNMSNMFQGSGGNSSHLTTVYVSNLWDVSNVTSSSNMFKHAKKLVGGNGTTFANNNPSDKTYARIDAPGTPGYFTEKTN